MDLERMEKVVPDLLDVMVVDVRLLRFLIGQDALTQHKKDDIMAEKTNAEKVDNLMEHIMKDLTNKYKPLLDALKHTKQYNVVEKLEGSSGAPPGTSSTPTVMASTNASSVMSSQDTIDEAIEKSGPAIKTAIEKHLVLLSSVEGLEISGQVINYLIQWEILTEESRNDLEDMDKNREKLNFVLKAMRKRPPVEWVLFAKILIHTGQGHQLRKIGLSAKEIKAINEEYCVKECKEDK